MACVDPDDPRAPYLQVADGLRAAIRSGEYPPLTRLPPYHVIAATWGVAINTARSAVMLLRDEGLVAIQHGKGSFVRAHPPDSAAPAGARQAPTGSPARSGDEARLWQAIADLRRRVAELEQRCDT